MSWGSLIKAHKAAESEQQEDAAASKRRKYTAKRCLETIDPVIHEIVEDIKRKSAMRHNPLLLDEIATKHGYTGRYLREQIKHRRIVKRWPDALKADVAAFIVYRDSAPTRQQIAEHYEISPDNIYSMVHGCHPSIDNQKRLLSAYKRKGLM